MSYFNYIIQIELKEVGKIRPKPDHNLDIYDHLHNEIDTARFRNEITNHRIGKDYFLPKAMYRIYSSLSIDGILKNVVEITVKAFQNYMIEDVEKHYSIIVVGNNNYAFHNLERVKD